jgi:colanic acid/amylovoran biosynthesis protein
MAALARRAWGSNAIVDFQDYGPGDSSISFGARSILRDIGRRDGPIKNKIRSYDIILDTGAGDSFADIYGMKRLASMVYAHYVARRMSVPIIMGPQTIGPFNSTIGRFVARRMLRGSVVVTARDNASAAYAVSLGRKVDSLATDVVFALPVEATPKSRDIILNVSGLLWFSDKHVNSANYRISVRDLVSSLEREGRSVALLAHVTNATSVTDDAAAIRELVADGSLRNEVLIPDSLSSVRQYVGSANLVIGSRMHACLNALSVGTPAIPWAYSRKFAPLLSDIGWDISIDLRDEPQPVTKTLSLIAATTEDEWHARVQNVLGQTDLRLSQAVHAMRQQPTVLV